jgi:hypothetical protein
LTKLNKKKREIEELKDIESENELHSSRTRIKTRMKYGKSAIEEENACKIQKFTKRKSKVGTKN